MRAYHEAEVAAHVRHPNVAAVVAMGTVDGEPFLATEYVFGIPASQVVERVQQSLVDPLPLPVALTLAVVVTLFEIDLKLSGGIFALTRASSYAGTSLLNSLIYGHMLVAIGSALVWVTLVLVSLRKFSNPPVPNAFGPTHRVWGRVGMLLMMASGLSAVPLYYLGFAA